MAIIEISIPGLVRVRTRTWSTELIVPPGIVTGAGYAVGDAAGLQMRIDLPFSSGVLQSVSYNDNDDEGLAVDLILSRAPLEITIADNAAFTYNKASKDVENQIGARLRFDLSLFEDYTNCQKACLDGIGRAFDLGTGRTIWAQMVAQGALNIAAGALPSFRLSFLGDY